MADSQSEKVKFYESRAKAKAELKRYQKQLVEAVDSAKKKVRVERLVKSCEEAMTKSFGKHEQLYSFANKTTHPGAYKNDLESWLSHVTAENDEVLEKAREYIDGLLETEKTSQTSVKTTPKTKSASQASKTSTFRILKHLARDSGNFSLENTDARRSNDRTKVGCAWLNISKNLTASDSRGKSSV